MKKAVPVIISILYASLIVNCYLEAPIQEPEAQSTEIMEEIIMNDFTVKPIEEFPAYYQAGNMVFGIPDSAQGPGDLVIVNPLIIVDGETLQSGFDKFFIIGGIPHFVLSLRFIKESADGETTDDETITKYCTQENGKISYLTEAKFPAMPESTRFEGMEGSQYTIETGDYEGQAISICDNGEYKETLIFVDGCIALPEGLLIHAPQGRGSARPDGLLFWPEGKRTMDHWKEAGRFWK